MPASASAAPKMINNRGYVLIAVLAVVLCGCSKSEDAPQGRVKQPSAMEGMVLIPGGEFIMGSDKTDDAGLQKEYGFVNPLYVDEHPPHKVPLPAFMIDKYEVTNAQYKAFILETKASDPPSWVQNGYNVRDDKLRGASLENLRWIATDYFKIDKDAGTMTREKLLAELEKIQHQRDKLPVTGVSWDDAYSYCKWAGKRLPSEAEWEKAARGAQGLEYPWGNQWDIKRPNTGANGEGAEAVVAPGSYAGDKSPYGVYDMAGNVSEWVDDWYRPYPGATYKHEAFGEVHKVVRGGGAGEGHYALSSFYRAARRAHAEPATISTDVGFRCAADAG